MEENAAKERQTYALGKLYEKRKIKDRHGALTVMSDETGISKNTIRRAEQFARGIDVLRRADPELALEILDGKRQVPMVDVMYIGTSSGNVHALIQELRAGMRISSTAQMDGRQSNVVTRLGTVRKDRRKNAAERLEELQRMRDISSASDRIFGGQAAKYTADDLIRSIRMNGDSFVDTLRQMIRHDAAVCDANRAAVAQAIHTHITEKLEAIEKEIMHHE